MAKPPIYQPGGQGPQSSAEVQATQHNNAISNITGGTQQTSATSTLGGWTSPWKKDEAAYNEAMMYKGWQREDELIKRQQEWENSAVQRKVEDIKKAGLNPYLAVMGNAAGAGVPNQNTNATSGKEITSDTGQLITGIMTLLGAILFAGTGLGKAAIGAKASRSKKGLSIIQKNWNH